MNFSFNCVKSTLLESVKVQLGITRLASKKAKGSTKNTSPKVRPKHRGWKVQDGHLVDAGHILVLQRNLRFHPGLNVGLGRNGTLFAIIPGKVSVTCERADPDWSHTWVQRCHGHRKDSNFFKKYFNVLPETQHQNFKLVDQL
ncbi:hypothetical protein JTB14_037629 [Gonioctena quinquepunctata]|nr:hypothetical protein JTB14_037629 [Gonioctena quinquepunctata]